MLPSMGQVLGGFSVLVSTSDVEGPVYTEPPRAPEEECGFSAVMRKEEWRCEGMIR